MEVAHGGERVVPVLIEEEMKRSYIDYAMSVIVGRALPDVRDGLKPVHRRILYSMWESKLTHDRPYKKSARVVGDVLGKYHPHGDAAVYDALVRMAQDFSLRYPLIDGQGNFGSIDGDEAAAMRYTEVRLEKIAEEMLADIEKDTVDFVPNYDSSLKEPVVLPSRLPNLLVNGSSGIAVGMATNIPPHNLSEVCDAIVALIDDPDIDVDGLMRHIKGPDFPTGAVIFGVDGIRSAYESGRGTIKIRAVASIEPLRGGREAIVITELPYQVNKAQLIEHIARLVREGVLSGISNIRDESDKEGIRVVIELKRGTNSSVVLNRLYRHTKCELSFGIINLALVDGEPRELSLKQMLWLFVEHRRDVIRRRSSFELHQAEQRIHVLEGLKLALDNLDEVVPLIRAAKTPRDAQQELIARFKMSELQAQKILEMPLRRLTALEREKLDEEHAQLKKRAEHLRALLADDSLIMAEIKREVMELREMYGDERRTRIEGDIVEMDAEDLIADEEVVVSLTHGGYLKRTPLRAYRTQRRGGKGVKGMDTKDSDHVENFHIASTHDHMLFFTNRGVAYRLRVYELPEGERHAMGKPVVNFLSLTKGERITAMIPVRDVSEGRYLTMATRKGFVKRLSLNELAHAGRRGVRAIGLVEGDELVGVRLTDGHSDVVLSTKLGYSLVFSEDEVRQMGRTARGVRGITLREGDEVVSLAVLTEGVQLLSITERGYGKRMSPEELRSIKRGMRRGAKGVITTKITSQTGYLMGVREVHPEDEVVLSTENGAVIRMGTSQIAQYGRSARGVRVMDVSENDRVVSFSIVPKDAETERR
ncbi:DNA gyrase subunit A [Methermicoccus shengliensis]|uniref:DNA gyrase subunit A n=1 Tax=Methermicoccus shengliensis TaxID=660064 RepID=A0A832RUK1_9EURY|nr:DNA gyrase subunit A [Methermicoccus shengliensis]KUK04663.1 MAG: DNA gyrase subunit A [Euryarchaeota archaeon 55_53]KUK30790.1 MAG: DNA gyrase subunit A [Methanosarcinales archeaon 56_1174]MDI3487943.1 gyrase subunit [Methanosarcinales archaeon]MDN5295081.1 gyrase subunit [Methanosarcinales archaeon]HIH69105.1 DNA gyrase subunit A [Methermicoccus shengliensis]